MTTARAEPRDPRVTDEERRRRLTRLRTLTGRPDGPRSEGAGRARPAPHRWLARLSPPLTLALLAGAWLLVSSLVLDFRTGGGEAFGAGLLLVVLALVRAAIPAVVRTLIALQGLVGAAVLLAALLVHESPGIQVSAAVTGTVVLLATAWSFLQIARITRRR